MSKKDLSERDICTQFITPAITAPGKWDLTTQVREEVSFTNGRILVTNQKRVATGTNNLLLMEFFLMLICGHVVSSVYPVHF